MHHTLSINRGAHALGGSLWLPDRGQPHALVLMHPGSGPSDRHNDVLFPPIRSHLLAHGFGVCSFDKRGVGASSGRWQEAGIVEQADDLLAALSALHADRHVRAPVGLFGHSQGGWVVLEAAGRGAPPAFVISNSGPGVTPAAQERYALQRRLLATGTSLTETEAVLRCFDLVIRALQEGSDPTEGETRLAQAGCASLAERYRLQQEHIGDWGLARKLAVYDPRPALDRIRVPVLAIFGAEDPLVPVDSSIAVYREAVPAELLSIVVLAGADHRLQVGQPPRLADEYLRVLTAFLVRVVAPASPAA